MSRHVRVSHLLMSSGLALTLHEGIAQYHLVIIYCHCVSCPWKRQLILWNWWNVCQLSITVAAFMKLMNKTQMKLCVLRVLFHLSSLLADCDSDSDQLTMNWKCCMLSSLVISWNIVNAARHTCRRTYVLSWLFLSFFFSSDTLRARWTELNQNR